MPISHKGISMLLKHHALHPTESSDDDVKNSIDAEIKNSDEESPDETELTGENSSQDEEPVKNSDADEDDDSAVTNREVELQNQVVELTKQVRALTPAVHNRSAAKAPSVDLDQEIQQVEEGQVIANRAMELQKMHPGMSLASAFENAAKEQKKKK